MKIIYDMANKISEKSSLDPRIVRMLYIKAIIRQQIIEENFHFEFEEHLPQARIQGSMKFLDYLREEFLKILNNIDDINDLMQINNEVLDYYVEKYAGRQPNTDLI